ncbi:MAG: DNA mismatch repair endonuclease MutL [Halobacteriovoraceae bacterium]|nr:DNA mismatch repair endonuclease MutL [Halobacteriovoraceae bacterium]MCB9093640.1 DNA mismatch repair endonuclease MutL [Halobacteriovoraceae bacterium]
MEIPNTGEAVHKINLLPEHVIDQIKAGEVIDSTAGLLKELLENSIDAGATRIEIHLINNGLDFLSFKDNGHGMDFDDLPWAFARHATSKISKFEDLYHLHSYGFRGEALASLASVAKVSCTTTNSQMSSSRIVIEGGHTHVHEKLSYSQSQSGTELVIKDLFFNTPVRLKFLSHQKSEKNKIKKMIQNSILSQPQVEFHIKWDDKDKKVISPSTSLKERFLNLYNEKSDENLIEREQSFEDMRLHFYFIESEKSSALQQIYVNSRPIEDEKLRNTLNFFINETYQSKKFPWILWLELPSYKVDFNVHPKKTQVKFFQDSLVRSFMSQSVKKALSKATQPKHQGNFMGSPEQHPSFCSPSSLSSEDKIQTQYNRVIFQWNNTQFLIQHENKLYGTTSKTLIETLLTLNSQHSSAIIPLLISEPLQIPTSAVEKLQSFGFELSSIDNQGDYTLRSYPEIFSDLPLKILLEKLAVNELHQVPLPESSVDKILSKFEFNTFVENNAFHEINPNEIFYS